VALTLSWHIVPIAIERQLVTVANNLRIDRPRFSPRSLNAYVIAGSCAAIATALRLALLPGPATTPFVFLFPAVIVTTFLCGSTAGLLNVALSILSVWLLIVPQQISELLLYQTFLFCIGSVTLVAAIGLMRAATAKLQLSEEKFRGLLESAPDAIVILDERDRITLINAPAEEMFGYQRKELLGQPIGMLLRGYNSGTLASSLAAPVSDRQVHPRFGISNLDGLRKDGTVFPAEASFGRLQTKSGTLVSAAIRDITAQRQIKADLEKLNQVKSDFLANVSHELRTPLNAIIGFSELIRDGSIGPLDAKYREYAGDIHESGQHLLKIINAILDISKIERGRFELRNDVVSIGETIERCRRMVGPMALAAGVSLSADFSGSLPLIHADEVRFQEILLNLMSNAVKFTPTGGAVTISASIEAGGLVIAVKDTGIGMEESDLAVALEPFRQIDGRWNRQFAGTGLGLPLAKRLVELHGGNLAIESKPGLGTTVRIRLPSERIMAAAA
jgi:PAS domain S-box-containing protein